MTKKNEVVVTSKTTITFKFNSDQSVYNLLSSERKYIWKVTGQILDVNEEELKYLRQLYHWNELREKVKFSRCQVCGKENKYNFEFKEKRIMFYKKVVKKSNKKICKYYWTGNKYFIVTYENSFIYYINTKIDYCKWNW